MSVLFETQELFLFGRKAQRTGLLFFVCFAANICVLFAGVIRCSHVTRDIVPLYKTYKLDCVYNVSQHMHIHCIKDDPQTSYINNSKTLCRCLQCSGLSLRLLEGNRHDIASVLS